MGEVISLNFSRAVPGPGWLVSKLKNKQYITKITPTKMIITFRWTMPRTDPSIPLI